MSYATAEALQTAVFSALSTDASLGALVGNAIFDSTPGGAIPGTYVSLGEEVVKDASDRTGGGAIHDLTITVATDQPGFSSAKQVAAAVCDVLIDADLILARGSLVSLNFLGARAKRTRADAFRRIDLRFRARTEVT